MPQLHPWHPSDGRPTHQPSRRHLIPPHRQDLRGDLRESKRCASARGARSDASRSDASSSRPQTARRARAGDGGWGNEGGPCPSRGRGGPFSQTSAGSSRGSTNTLSNWSVPSSKSSLSHLPLTIDSSSVQKRSKAHHAERTHGAFGGGMEAGAPSGHGLAAPFIYDMRRFDKMVEKERAVHADNCKGPAYDPPKPARVPDETKDKITRKGWQAPPGYGGFRAGVYAGNVYGGTYHRDNKEGIKLMEKHHNGKELKPVSGSFLSRQASTKESSWVKPKNNRPPAKVGLTGSFSTGTEIPGYGGFVPGNYAGNLIGSCVPRATKSGWEPAGDGPHPPLIVHSPGTVGGTAWENEPTRPYGITS